MYQVWYIPKNEPTYAIMLMPGEYPEMLDVDGNFIENPDERLLMPYHTQMAHKFKTYNKKRNKDMYFTVGCSAGPDTYHRQPCIGCELRGDGDNPEAQNESISVARPLTYWNIIILSWYHRVAAMDKEGKQIISKKGEPVFNLRECTWDKDGKCEHCDDDNQDLIFGKRGFLELGSNHTQHLSTIIEDIEARCVCGGDIKIKELVCAKCKAVAIDVAAERLKQDEIDPWLASQHQCSECGHDGFLEEVIGCSNKKTCGGAERQSAWERPIMLKKTGDGTASAIKEHRVYTVDDYIIPGDYDGAEPPPLTDWLTEELLKPDDAVVFFAPPGVDAQADTYGDNPFSASSAKKDTMPYAGKKADFNEEQGGKKPKQPRLTSKPGGPRRRV